jgi:Zn-dependent protease with chaperone function
MKTVDASYFDGQSARQQAVTLSMANGLLELHADGLLREVPLSQVRLSTRLGNTPRLLHFSDGGHCEIRNNTDLDALLQAAGLQPQSLVSRLENSWRHALTATLLAIAFVIAAFYWGLPRFASVVAERIPAQLALSIDAHFLETADDGLMQPSQLAAARQQALQQRFNGLHHAQGQPPHELKVRSSKLIGANALALPGGTIVMTDQLVSLASHDEEILAVLAHELGHVNERHPLRQLLQSSAVGLAMTWYLGDISTLLAAAPTLLLETSYSRNFERRADRYAADMLRMNGIAPARLADILEKLELSHSGNKEKMGQPSPITEFFSTHPDTDERVRELRSMTLH